MHYGQLPALNAQLPTYTSALPSSLGSGAAQLSRRTALAGGLGMVLGLGTSSAMRGFTGETATAAKAAPAQQPPRGSLEWALSLHQAPDAELFDAAGDLERASLRLGSDHRLLPLFSRLLDIALTSGDSLADIAGQCAVRCLDRGGRADWVQLRRTPIQTHPRLHGTARLLRAIDRR